MPLCTLAIAAVLHAAWNVILKTGGDPLGTATRAMAGATLLWTPAVAVAWVATGMPANRAPSGEKPIA